MGTTLRARRRLVAAFAALGLVGALLMAVPPAGAASYDGVLGIKNAGSLYAGTDESGIVHGAYASQAVAPGATASYSVEVLNKGTSAGQFAVHVTNLYVGTVKLLVSNVDVTALATGFPGWVTNVLAPGKTQLITVKYTIPVGSGPGTNDNFDIELWSPDHSGYFGSVEVIGCVKTTTGTTSHDAFATTAGQQSVAGGVSTAATIKVNGTATFSIHIKNDTAVPTSVSLSEYAAFTCGSSFVAKGKVGSTDISGALNGAYQTPVLGKGQSITVSFAVKNTAAAPTGCANSQAYLFTAYDGTGYEQFDLVVNAV